MSLLFSMIRQRAAEKVSKARIARDLKISRMSIYGFLCTKVHEVPQGIRPNAGFA